MKKFFIFLIILLLFCFIPLPFKWARASSEENISSTPMMAIVIDDFGGYDQSGVETMLSINAPLTCAVMPHLENTKANAKQALESGKEVIVHMPMQACVHLPDSWYGSPYIGNIDTKQTVYSKLNSAFESVEGAKGFNIHIGSGVCQYSKVVSSIYDYATEKNYFFLDSRTHLNTICDKVANEKSVVYLGRDEFLEPNGDKSYNGVKNHLLIGANIALEKGYSVVIGHVGAHGGENTAKAIKDTINEIKSMGIEIVPLSKLHDKLNLSYVNKNKESINMNSTH